ncbi:Shedu anti-phage system protein SduA domain-containing protein [Longitalea arenae]|uniref:Shedu anti-phage system protein SduA domain-containing protein n=1 Tax=Longitalea arenae TaxID=2812558 RepID=UPI00196805B7|nr:Shedu anti-phage system protein SduA domain-containing protein [Longitalea arenae]
MTLYDRDFNFISEDERLIWEELKNQEKVFINGQLSNIRKSLYTKYPIAVRHFLSLFPNNFLDSVELRKKTESLIDKLDKFRMLLDNSAEERNILNFIKSENAYFIIGSILRNYRFGHHALYIFPEFMLPPNFKVDYLLIGRNSDGHHFVFVELENPNGNITNSDGFFGKTIRKGIKQADNWELWLEANFSSLRLVFEQALGKNEPLPKEFTVFDKTRIHFVVIAGRRKDFNEKTYRLQRNHSEQRKLQIFHYDNLIDFATEVIGKHAY